MSALSVRANTRAIIPGLTIFFAGFGGAPPYIFNVLDGGAGGSVNSATGAYTAPVGYGVDTIQITDSTGAFADTQILVGTHYQLVCDIISEGMGLEQGQVYFYNQKINTPTDQKLYVAVGALLCKPFGNSRKYDGDGPGLDAVQSTNFMATLQIDIKSRSVEAFNRKEELILALHSNYSQAQQELNSFYIAPITTSFVNLSEIDGSAIPYRFSINANIQYFIKKVVGVDYYDSFQKPNLITDP